MNDQEREMNHRILIIDDNLSIHKDFETIHSIINEAA